MDILIGLVLAAICLAVAYGGWKLYKYDRVHALIRKPIGGSLIGFGSLLALTFGVYGFFHQTPEERAASEAVAAREAEQQRLVDAERAEAERLEDIERQKAAQIAEAKKRADELEKRRSGLHCLSDWDGSNRNAVLLMRTSYLRDPDSFEHIETVISPLDESSGEHGAWMTYRARNGFGGMNVERIYMRIDSESCEARLLPDGPGS